MADVARAMQRALDKTENMKAELSGGSAPAGALGAGSGAAGEPPIPSEPEATKPAEGQAK